MRILLDGGRSRFMGQAVTAAPLAQAGFLVASDDVPLERDLVERAKRCPEALGLLYRMHVPRISNYVLRRVGDKHEAEDIVAAVFLAMVRQLPRYHSCDVPFSAWLYRIATNEINRWIRKRRIRNFFGTPPDIVDNSQPPSDEAELVRRALGKLPVHFQTVLSLYYLEQLSVDEVARIAGCPAGTVKSRLARGREMLQAELLRLSGD